MQTAPKRAVYAAHSSWAVISGAVGALLTANNSRVRAADGAHGNPRDVDGVAWNRVIEDAFVPIRAEWDVFALAGGRLPRIEQVLDEDQGNDGNWRAGMLITRSRPVLPLAERFPGTVAVLTEVPGMLSALWSVLDPGAELPEHQGPNAGVLRYHLPVVSNDETALRIAGTVVPYREGRGILFDDTAPHAAWNRGRTPRVTIMCELLRPLAGATAWMNRTTQALRAIDRRFRLAPKRAAEWERAINPDAARTHPMPRAGVE